jgi:hypothetical protein
MDLALEVTYEDVKVQIEKLVLCFRRRYGGDYEELKSMAGLLFVDAYNAYDRKRGCAFTSYIGSKIWNGLIDYLRANSARKRTMKSEVINLRSIADKEQSDFDLNEFMAMLSPDARRMVKLIVEKPPMDVLLAIRQRGKATPNNIWGGVKEFLFDIGWTSEMIRSSYSEIREALRQ